MIQGVGTNRYAYADNDPVNKSDPNGRILDTILDIGFLAYDVAALAYDEAVNDGANRSENLTALGLDTAATVTPFATGLGVASRVVSKTDDVAKGFSKLTQVERAKIVGTAQRTSREALSMKPLDAHQIGSLREAIKYAKNPEVGKVHLNRTVDTALGIKGVSSQRPDIAATSWDRKKTWMSEVPSGRQTPRNQREKMDKIRDRGGFSDKDKSRNSIGGRRNRDE